MEVTEGGGVVMTFVTGRSDCRWPVSTTADWVTVHTASVSGGGMLRFAVAVNAWGARTGAVTVGSLGLTVLQASDPGAPVWTDPVLTAGVTLVKAVHMTELRTRVDGVRAGCGLTGAVWTDPTLTVGVTAVKAAHVTELRTAVEGLERGQ